MGVSRAYAVAQVTQFNEYFNTLTAQQQQDYYGGRGSSLELYEICNCCGESHHNFRETKPGDCPDGCTIGPIIYEEQNDSH